VEGYFPDAYSNFNPTLVNPYAGGRLGGIEYAGTGEGRNGARSLYNAWPYGISPRLGIAYTIDDKTVLRASGARTFGSMKNTGGSSHFQGFIGNYSFNSANGNVAPAWNLDEGYPSWPAPPFLRIEGQNAANPGSNDAPFWQSYDSGRLPEFYNWSIGIQRALPGDCLGPVHREIEVAAAVVELADLERGDLAVLDHSMQRPFGNLQDRCNFRKSQQSDAVFLVFH
jgi:hypothetical protein